MTEIWTLTVDVDREIYTTVHSSEQDALRSLFENYDEVGEYGGDLQALIDGQCLIVHIEAHTLPPSVTERRDGTPRMTGAQRDRLWELCARHSVPFREDDYVLAGKQAGIGAGWVEGWVGGRDGSGVTSRKTIYVGVSPEGESHS